MSNWLTVEENLQNLALEVKEQLEKLRSFSSSRDTDFKSSRVAFFGPKYVWIELSSEGKIVQSTLRKKYIQYFELLKILFVNHPKSVTNKLADTDKKILLAINQDNLTWSGHNEAFSQAILSLDEQTKLLEQALKVERPEYVFVPDTNTLIGNPNLEGWNFDGITRFGILLLPTVLSELDKLKINHRNEQVRDKCNSLIRRIKDYRRRGRLNDGVPVVRDRIYIQSEAVEPNFENTLPWLDPLNNDDRILAGFIEAMRQRTNSYVVLVTTDINLQNKAEFAGLPFTEPPN